MEKNGMISFGLAPKPQPTEIPESVHSTNTAHSVNSPNRIGSSQEPLVIPGPHEIQSIHSTPQSVNSTPSRARLLPNPTLSHYQSAPSMAQYPYSAIPGRSQYYSTPTRALQEDDRREYQAQQQRVAYQHYIQHRALQQQRYAVFVHQQQQQQQYQYYQQMGQQQMGQQYGYHGRPMNQGVTQSMMSPYPQYPARGTQPAQPMGRGTRNGPIILSSEEQPLLMSAEQTEKPRPRRRKRKRVSSGDGDEHYVVRSETVSLDIDEEESAGLDKNGYDKYTFVNMNEYLPAIDDEFEEWLFFSKKLWKRQRKYRDKGYAVDPLVADSISTSLDSPIASPERSPREFQFKSVFLKGRMRSKHNVLRKSKVVNIMQTLGLAPPWNAMKKYKKWRECFQWNKGRKSKKGKATDGLRVGPRLK